MNQEFDIFKYQENDYKITILYLLKEVSLDIKETILNLVDINLEKEISLDIKETILNLVDINLEKEMNYIDYFEEIIS